MPMNYEKLAKQAKYHEGFSRKVYICPGDKQSIGYGRNLDDVGITEEEAEYLLMNDLAKAESRLEKFSWYRILNEARKAVLINMAFNLGFAGLMKFNKTIEHIRNGNFNAASIEMLDSKWANQVGSRAIELSEQMKSGEW